MTGTIVGIAGSQSRVSRTRALVNVAVARASARFSLTGSVFDLGDLGPSLGTASRLKDLAPPALRKVEALLDADALVVASPVYKGSYAGLFKHLFDMFDPSALHGKPVLLAATGGGDRHALMIEHQLRPLLGFFEAASLPTGVYASDTDFAEGQLSSPAVLARLDRAIAQFETFLPPGRTTPVPDRAAAQNLTSAIQGDQR